MPHAGAEQFGTGDTEAEGEIRLPNLEGRTVAGKYAIGRLLGAGGMGAVYEATNTATQEPCAIKLLLRGGLEREPAAVKRFLREALASSLIESEHIVRIHDSGVDAEHGCPFLVMDLLHGEDLEHVLERARPLRPDAVLEIVIQACAGLSRAHEIGIVHRDIKPANLFLEQTPDGSLRVKLLDFGVAKVKPNGLDGAPLPLTRSGSVLGTPLYMSPEQIRKAAEVDAASDVWSLGILMWTALSGAVPYSETSSLGALLACIITEPIPQIQDRAPWVSAELSAITHRALSRDLAHRFRHAGELGDALRKLRPTAARGLGPESLVTVPEEERERLAPRREPHAPTIALTPASPRRSRLGLIVALGCTALVGGLAASKLTPPSAPAARAVHGARSAPSGPSAPLDADAPRRFSFRVVPADVEVAVDGEAARVEGGQVHVEGRLGTIRSVRLRHRGAEQNYEIALTERGAVPQQLSLADRAPAHPARAQRVEAPAPRRAPVTATSGASTNRRLDTSLDEFD